MEIEYVPPVSWNDKGMNWGKPAADITDYAMAIQSAIVERWSVCNARVDLIYRSPVTRDGILNYDFFVRARSALVALAPKFLDIQNVDDDYETFDYPYWTYDELNDIEDCRICELPTRYSPSSAFAQWLINAKNYLNHLYVIPYLKSFSPSGYGEVHDPPFGESVSESISIAMRKYEDREFDLGGRDISTYSQNTHYTDQEGEDEDEDGYCGYAHIKSSETVKIKMFPYDFELGAIVCCAKLDDTPVQYSDELSSNVFDSGNSGLQEGLNVLTGDEIVIGSTTITPNASKPVSHFDHDDESKTVRRSTKTGFRGKYFCYADFSASNGFRFVDR